MADPALRTDAGSALRARLSVARLTGAWVLLAGLFGGFPAVARAGAPLIGWSAIARKVVPAVVNIEVLTIAHGHKPHALGERQEDVGSGFIVDPSGIIVTNKHVIQGAFQITVTLQDGTELPARVIAAAKLVDLAILKIDAGHPLPVLHLAPPGAVQPGDPVLAVGNPQGIGTSLSAGIVSAVDRDLMKTPFDDYVQTDAAINHGNSGGPLIDTSGQVVGVDTILLTNLPNEGSNGIGFAISSTVVGFVVRHLLNPTQVTVGWIGTQLQAVTPALADAFGMARPRGFLVTGIDPDSPAQRAGLQSGDVILRLVGAKAQPRNARQLMGDISSAPIGRPVTLVVWRDGHVFRASPAVRVWPDLMEERSAMGLGPGATVPLPAPDLGLLMTRITPMARSQYRLGTAHGVLVVAVDKQSDAYVHGIAVGDVIERVNGKPVTTPAQVYQLVHQATVRHRFVAVLLRWKSGTRWIPLRVGPIQTSGEALAAGMADHTVDQQAADRQAPARH